MLIIEGPDNLGKSTLAHKVKDKANQIWEGLELGKSPFRYRHMGRPDEDTFDFLNDYCPMMNPFYVQDRFHLGGLVWHSGKIDQASLRITEGRIRSMGGIIVIMYTSDHVWFRKRMEQDKRDQLFDTPAICEANIKYKTFVERQCNPIVDYDYRWDVKNGNYPDDNFVGKIALDWIRRLQLVGGFHVK